VVDNDYGQPRSAAIGGSGLMGSRRLVHTVNLKGPAGMVGSALIFGITQI
jgi:hypothetical protein